MYAFPLQNILLLVYRLTATENLFYSTVYSNIVLLHWVSGKLLVSSLRRQNGTNLKEI